jgi:hypothetical protein
VASGDLEDGMTVTLIKTDGDTQWFKDHPGRQAHIRLPIKTLEVDRKSRQSRFVEESQGEFWSLGEHNKDRRRILLWKVPKDNPYYDRNKPQILKIPFLAFADETIEDRDDILLPILHEIMVNAK